MTDAVDKINAISGSTGVSLLKPTMTTRFRLVTADGSDILIENETAGQLKSRVQSMVMTAQAYFPGQKASRDRVTRLQVLVFTTDGASDGTYTDSESRALPVKLESTPSRYHAGTAGEPTASRN